MNFVSRHGDVVVVRQVPFVLLFVAALFTLPPLVYSIFHLVRGTDAQGKYFCLGFGLLVLWLMLEFVATRERFDINPVTRTLSRTVSGVFKHSQQQIDLRQVDRIGIELKTNSRGRIRQHLYLYGERRPVLINTVGKVYIDHHKIGRTLSEITSIPFEETI